MSAKEELKDRLRKGLELREKKAADLSRDLNIPKSAISQYLSGYRTIKDSRRLYIIAEYLDVSEAWLMGFDVPMERRLTEIEEKVEEAGQMVGKALKNGDFLLLLSLYEQLDDAGKKDAIKHLEYLVYKNQSTIL